MKLHKIEVQGFKSLYDKTTIDFDDMRGMWKISGMVGAGKTTIGEVIMFGLFGDVKNKNNADFVSWGQKKGYVDMWCESRGHNIFIHRELRLVGQSPIDVTIDDEPLIFTNKRDAQAQLERDYYDVSRMTLELLCIISLNNFKSIATLNTQDTKNFLDQVFGFYILTNYADIIKNNRNAIDKEMNDLGIEQSINEKNLETLIEMCNKVKPIGDVGELTKELNVLLESQKDLAKGYQTSYSDMNKDVMTKQSDLAVIRSLGTNKKKEIDFIKQGKCPTCGAPIDQSMLSDKENEREVLLREYASKNDELVKAKESLHKLQEEYNEKYAQLNTQIIEKKSLISSIETQSKSENVNKEEIQKARKKIKSIEKELSKKQKDYNEWNELFDIIALDVRTKIMSNFIPLLNQNIAIYISQLQQPYTVTFDNNFKCSVSLFGVDNPIPIASLSTGQLKAIDMTIILGVLSIIMHNVNFNVMFIDELMSNMDSDLRDVLCEVLRQNCSEDHTLFVISHTDLDDKYFDGTIQMKLQNHNSFSKKSVMNITKK